MKLIFQAKKLPFQLVECYKRSILPNFPTVEDGRGCIVRTMFLGVKIMISIDFSCQKTCISLVRTSKTANLRKPLILSNFPTVPIENGRGCIIQIMLLGVKIMIGIDFSSQKSPFQ